MNQTKTKYDSAVSPNLHHEEKLIPMSIFYRLPKPVLSIVLILFASGLLAQSYTLITWNIRDFGARLSEIQLDSIAIKISSSDLSALQELGLNDGVDRTLDKLHERLQLLDPNWEMTLSEPTVSQPHYSERYVYFWRSDRVKAIGQPWLERHYPNVFEREPYMQKFLIGGQVMVFGNIHARSKKNNPEAELKYLKYLPILYRKPMVMMGDFNVEPNNSVFIPLLSAGYKLANDSIKTSLKTKFVDGMDPGSRAIDNILLAPHVNIQEVKTLEIHDEVFFKFWHGVSDHLPLIVRVGFNSADQ